jgi:hypothetical protein
MKLSVVFLLLLMTLAACANVSEPPLPVVNPSDPVWQPATDHPDFGVLS